MPRIIPSLFLYKVQRRLDYYFFRLFHWALAIVDVGHKVPLGGISEDDLRFGFFPYGSTDCQLIHTYYSKLLHKKFPNSKFDVVHDLSNLYSKFHGHLMPAPTGQFSYREKMDLLLAECDNNLEVFRGAADEYRRNCVVEEFFSASEINVQLWTRIQCARETAFQIASEYDVLFVPDLAYTFNRTLNSEATRLGKKVFCLNPHGQLRDLSQNQLYPSQTRMIDEMINSISKLAEPAFNVLLEKAIVFIEKRKLGEMKFDRDSILAYKVSDSLAIKPKVDVVLYLHCFRDASREKLILDKERQFIDYIEWTRFMLGRLKRSEVNWKIKVHPNSFQYEGDTEILARLLSEQEIDPDYLNSCPSTAEIIREEISVLTYSGTVALESAAAGFKSKSVGNYYPEWLIQKISLELTDFNLVSNVRLSPQDQNLAKIALFLSSKGSRPIWRVCPRVPMVPTRNALMKFRREIFSSLTLANNFTRKSNREFLAKTINFIELGIQNLPTLSIEIENG
jgi:hypothetical protein